MNRIIEFRAWDDHKKIMIYDYDQKVANIYNLKLGDSIHDTVYRIGMAYDSLMQYTGLKDSYGNKIYEKDIIYDGGSNIIVEFKQPSIKVTYGQGDCCYDANIILFSNYGQGNKIKLVGNIYENPELLSVT